MIFRNRFLVTLVGCIYFLGRNWCLSENILFMALRYCLKCWFNSLRKKKITCNRCIGSEKVCSFNSCNDYSTVSFLGTGASSNFYTLSLNHSSHQITSSLPYFLLSDLLLLSSNLTKNHTKENSLYTKLIHFTMENLANSALLVESIENPLAIVPYSSSSSSSKDNSEKCMSFV